MPDHAGEVDGAAPIDEELGAAHDLRIRLWNINKCNALGSREGMDQMRLMEIIYFSDVVRRPLIFDMEIGIKTHSARCLIKD